MCNWFVILRTPCGCMSSISPGVKRCMTAQDLRPDTDETTALLYWMLLLAHYSTPLLSWTLE